MRGGRGRREEGGGGVGERRGGRRKEEGEREEEEGEKCGERRVEGERGKMEENYSSHESESGGIKLRLSEYFAELASAAVQITVIF